jgi:AraC-like DNA-binding protein
MVSSTVAASITSRMVDYAVEHGACRERLLRLAGLAASLPEDPDDRIPLDKHVALLRAAKQLCGDPAFALHYGAAVDLAEVSVVGLIGHASETMLEAFVQLQRYARLMMDFDVGVQPRFALERHTAGALWLVDHRPGANATPELTETVFAQMVCGTRRFGVTGLVRSAHVTHADPGYRHEYERILGAPVRFGADRNALLIDEGWLTHRIAVQPRYAFAILTRHADAVLTRLDEGGTTTARVEQALLAALHTGTLQATAIAARLGCSRAALYRRLKREATNYEQVLDRLRQRMAREYLGGGRVSVNETAYLLGYSEPAAFSRAFKRWTGRSPSDYRSRPSDAD